MNLPKIDISALPDLGTLTGMFGSMPGLSARGPDDSVIVIMVYIYELVPPSAAAGLL